MTGLLPKLTPALLVLAALGAVARAVEYISPGLTPEQVLQKLDSDKPPLVVGVRKPEGQNGNPVT